MNGFTFIYVPTLLISWCTKGKLDEDVGQPGIRGIPGCPTRDILLYIWAKFMVEDGLSVLRFYFSIVNILIIHTICNLLAFLRNTIYVPFVSCG